MLHRTRRIARLSTPLLALALMPVAAANATAPAHLVSLDQARKAMPQLSTMPGHPDSVTTSTNATLTAIAPCLGPDVKPLKLKLSHAVTSLYVAAPTATNAVPSQFSITAVVFHTVAAAKVGMEAIVHAEAHCPKQGGDSEASFSRTLSTKYATSGWTGWRSTDHLTIAPDPADATDPGIALRLNEEYLLRGNVLLVLNEAGALAGSGAKQDADRKKATIAMLAGYHKL